MYQMSDIGQILPIAHLRPDFQDLFLFSHLNIWKAVWIMGKKFVVICVATQVFFFKLVLLISLLLSVVSCVLICSNFFFTFFSVVSFELCGCPREGKHKCPHKCAFNAPETWASLLTTFERDNCNDRTWKFNSICPHYTMCLSKLHNVFVHIAQCICKIAQCICQNCTMYLSKLQMYLSKL